MLCAQLSGHEAAEHVDFVAVSCRDDKIGSSDTGFDHQSPVYRVSWHAEHVEPVLHLQELFFVMVYGYYAVTFLSELLREQASDFSGPDNNDFHFIASLEMYIIILR